MDDVITVWAEREDLQPSTICMIGDNILVDLEKKQVAIKWSIRRGYALERKARMQDEELRKYHPILLPTTLFRWFLPFGLTLIVHNLSVDTEYWTKVPWKEIMWKV